MRGRSLFHFIYTLFVLLSTINFRGASPYTVILPPYTLRAPPQSFLRSLLSADPRRSLILDACTLSLQEGETVALVGIPGSGKTTLMLALHSCLSVSKGGVKELELIGRGPKPEIEVEVSERHLFVRQRVHCMPW